MLVSIDRPQGDHADRAPAASAAIAPMAATAVITRPGGRSSRRRCREPELILPGRDSDGPGPRPPIEEHRRPCGPGSGRSGPPSASPAAGCRGPVRRRPAPPATARVVAPSPRRCPIRRPVRRHRRRARSRESPERRSPATRPTTARPSRRVGTSSASADSESWAGSWPTITRRVPSPGRSTSRVGERLPERLAGAASRRQEGQQGVVRNAGDRNLGGTARRHGAGQIPGDLVRPAGPEPPARSGSGEGGEEAADSSSRPIPARSRARRISAWVLSSPNTIRASTPTATASSTTTTVIAAEPRRGVGVVGASCGGASPGIAAPAGPAVRRW